MKTLKRIAAIAAGSALLVAPLASHAQSDYPNRPVKLVVGFAPGGTIGADMVAKAAPDGYTLTLATTSTHAISAGAYSKLPFVAVRDFTPISLVAITPYLLVVNAQVPVRTLDEFVKHAKANEGKLNYASAGNGTASRSPAMPDVPTVSELGYPGFNAALWLGVMGPANMPKPVVERLHKEIVAIVATQEFRKAMDANGAEPVSSPAPEDFARMLRAEVERYTKLVQGLGIKLD